MAGERILVVDDEPAIREMLKAVLEEDGYRCSTASGYESALRAISSQPFDLMLLDMVMPRHSGMDLFREVRRSDKGVAVVFITATAEPSVVDDVTASGASGYLVKPVSLTEMGTVVAQALKKRDDGIRSAVRLQRGPGIPRTGG